MSGSASISLEQAILGHTLGFAQMAFRSPVYVALCSASMPPSETVHGIEAFGGGYTRMRATFALIDTPANIAANTTSIEWPVATASWGTLGYFELWDAPTGGNRLYWGQFSPATPIVVASGDVMRVSAGSLAVQAASGTGSTTSIGAYLPLAGGQMNGPLQLFREPTGLSEAATKSYVDAHSGTGGGPGFLPLSGGTMLGQLTLAGNATLPLQAVPLRQVDTLNVVNVLNHGAKGDGTTDDTAAIQAVLNTYAGKATVFIPDTGSTYRINTLIVPTGTDLLIHGKVLALPAVNLLFHIANVGNVTMRGHGTIDGNYNTGFAGLQVCLNCDTATNVRISGLTLQNSTNFNLAVTNSSYVYVDSVRLLGGVNASGFNWSTHCWISRSYINTGSNDDGWAFYGGCSNCGISNCEATGARVGGISIYADGTGPTGNPTFVPSQNIVIANNICHGNGENGIEVRSQEPPYYLHTGIVITGNRCYANSATGNPQCADIWISSADGVTISGNNLSGSGSGNNPAWGIWVGNHASHVSITGNSIWNEGQGGIVGVGIYLQVPNDVLIEGNYFYDNQITHTMQYAIDGTAGLRTAITGNFFGVLGSGTPIHMLPAADTISANSMLGTWNAGTGTGSQGASIGINAPVTYNAMVLYRANSAMRWFVGTDGGSEPGGDVGTNYGIIPCTDAGAPKATALDISRATGKVTLAVAPTITTLPTNAATDAAASAAGVPVGGLYRNGSVLMVRTV